MQGVGQQQPAKGVGPHLVCWGAGRPPGAAPFLAAQQATVARTNHAGASLNVGAAIIWLFFPS
jgi:hypothetical protein